MFCTSGKATRPTQNLDLSCGDFLFEYGRHFLGAMALKPIPIIPAEPYCIEFFDFLLTEITRIQSFPTTRNMTSKCTPSISQQSATSVESYSGLDFD